MNCLNPLLKTHLSDRVLTVHTRVLFSFSAVSGNYRKEQDASLQFFRKIQKVRIFITLPSGESLALF